MIFDLGSNFDSPNDDSGSRFIYIWLSVDDFRSRISSFFFCIIWGQGLIFDWWLRVRDNFDWEVVCSSLSPKWLILEIVFNVLMKLCPLGSLFMNIFLLRWFVEILIVKNFLFLEIFLVFFFFFVEILFFEIFPLWRFVQCSSWGLKIVLVCSYWGLKSLCW